MRKALGNWREKWEARRESEATGPQWTTRARPGQRLEGIIHVTKPCWHSVYTTMLSKMYFYFVQNTAVHRPQKKKNYIKGKRWIRKVEKGKLHEKRKKDEIPRTKQSRSQKKKKVREKKLFPFMTHLDANNHESGTYILYDRMLNSDIQGRDSYG